MTDPVRDTVDDIAALRIQGATNVALTVLDTLADLLKSRPDISYYELVKTGQRLAYARPTEPLAQNAVRYVTEGDLATTANRIVKYKSFITAAKRSIPGKGASVLVDGGSYLTLCHSSTTVDLFTEARKHGAYFSLYVAETRPRMQGRITAKELLAAGFDDVTMIIDDVAVSLIEGRKGTIDAVFIGSDLLTSKGFVNKVGSLALAAAAKRKRIPVYVITTLLKFDPTPFSPAMIETRSPSEIWENAPEGLRFYAPAFDYVPFASNVHLVCEEGILSGKKAKAAAGKRYPFIFDANTKRRMYYGKSVQ